MRRQKKIIIEEKARENTKYNNKYNTMTMDIRRGVQTPGALPRQAGDPVPSCAIRESRVVSLRYVYYI